MNALQIGSMLGPYRITAPVAAGGMGEVWRAERVIASGRDQAPRTIGARRRTPSRIVATSDAYETRR